MPKTAVLEPMDRGVIDHRVEPGDDSSACSAALQDECYRPHGIIHFGNALPTKKDRSGQPLLMIAPPAFEQEPPACVACSDVADRRPQ